MDGRHRRRALMGYLRIERVPETPECFAWVESIWISKTLRDLVAVAHLGVAALHRPVHADWRRGLSGLRPMGLVRGLSICHVKALMPWAIAGFVINAVTGVLFLIIQPHLYVGSAVWWAKMGFIGVAGANAMFFETRLAVPALAMHPDEDTSTTMKAIGAVLFSAGSR